MLKRTMLNEYRHLLETYYSNYISHPQPQMFKKIYQEKTKGILQDITSWFVSNEIILSNGMPELKNLTKVDFSNILQIIDWKT